MTRLQLASRLRKDPRTIAKWLEEGLPVARRGRGGRPSLYDAKSVRAWVARRETTANGEPVARERDRRDRAQALLAEQLHDLRARRLLPVEEVERVWVAEVAAVRAIILASYTTHADRVHRAATLDGLAGVERELKALAYEVLRELARPDRPVPPLPGPSEPTDASAPAQKPKRGTSRAA